MPSTSTPLYNCFLSCVSKEFHNGGHLGSSHSNFESCRTRLATDLGSCGFHVAHQEEFAPSGGDLLEKLDRYIQDCAALVHLVGDMTGSIPTCDEVLALFSRHADFLYHRPSLKQAVGDGSGISYTQWEVLLAIHYRLPCFVFRKTNKFFDGPDYKLDQTESIIQDKHWSRLRGTGRSYEYFDSSQHLSNRVLIGFYRDKLIRSLPMGLAPNNLPSISIGSLFKGRETFLSQIDDSLLTIARSTPTLPTVIHALGGQGKTRAALEYAWSRYSEFTAVLFASAISATQLFTSLSELYYVLPVTLETSASQEESARHLAVMHWFQQNENWLLILDNVDTPAAASAVRILLPKMRLGSVMITSRIAIWEIGVNAINLPPLSSEAGRDFILEATENWRPHEPLDTKQALAISSDLCHLPLALQQAAAYVKRRRVSLATYRQEWATRKEEILLKQQRDKLNGKSLFDYPSELLTTWETTRLQMTPGAQALLDLLAWLAPHPIPFHFVVDLSQPYCADAEEFLLELADWHFADFLSGRSAVQIHAMIQHITRHRLKESGSHQRSMEAALGTLAKITSVDVSDVRHWPTVIPLQEHLAEAASICEVNSHYEAAVKFHNRCGRIHQAKGMFEPAETAYRKAADVAVRYYGNIHWSTSLSKNNLAQVLHATHRLDEAELLMREVLDIDESLFAPDNPNLGRDLNNLGGLLLERGRFAEAEEYLARAISIDEANFGEDSTDVAIDLSNIAKLQKSTGRLKQAESSLRKALEIYHKRNGPRHPDTARAMGDLANFLVDVNRLDGVEEMMRQALEIDMQAFGGDHPTVATRLNNLSNLLGILKNYKEAELLAHESLRIREICFGTIDPYVADVLTNLATTYYETDRFHEAHEAIQRATNIHESVFGENHESVALKLNVTALIHLALGRKQEAEFAMRRHLKIYFEHRVSCGHPHKNETAAIQNYFNLCENPQYSESDRLDTISTLADNAGLPRDKLSQLLEAALGQKAKTEFNEPPEIDGGR